VSWRRRGGGFRGERETLDSQGLEPAGKGNAGCQRAPPPRARTLPGGRVHRSSSSVARWDRSCGYRRNRATGGAARDSSARSVARRVNLRSLDPEARHGRWRPRSTRRTGCCSRATTGIAGEPVPRMARAERTRRLTVFGAIQARATRTVCAPLWRARERSARRRRRCSRPLGMCRAEALRRLEPILVDLERPNPGLECLARNAEPGCCPRRA